MDSLIGQNENEEKIPEYSKSRVNRPRSGNVSKNEPPMTTKPKINKNTEALLQNRNQRLQKQEEAKAQKLKERSVTKETVLKASDKFVIQKFNREFDNIRDDLGLPDEDQNEAGNTEQQQFSPQPERGKFDTQNKNINAVLNLD